MSILYSLHIAPGVACTARRRNVGEAQDENDPSLGRPNNGTPVGRLPEVDMGRRRPWMAAASGLDGAGSVNGGRVW